MCTARDDIPASTAQHHQRWPFALVRVCASVPSITAHASTTSLPWKCKTKLGRQALVHYLQEIAVACPNPGKKNSSPFRPWRLLQFERTSSLEGRYFRHDLTQTQPSTETIPQNVLLRATKTLKKAFVKTSNRRWHLFVGS